jgi:hypothetical protein
MFLSRQPLRLAIDKHMSAVVARGYSIIAEEEDNYFGNGHYALASQSTTLRLMVDRDRGIDQILFAFPDSRWIDSGLASVAIGIAGKQFELKKRSFRRLAIELTNNIATLEAISDGNWRPAQARLEDWNRRAMREMGGMPLERAPNNPLDRSRPR